MIFVFEGWARHLSGIELLQSFLGERLLFPLAVRGGQQRELILELRVVRGEYGQVQLEEECDCIREVRAELFRRLRVAYELDG